MKWFWDLNKIKIHNPIKDTKATVIDRDGGKLVTHPNYDILDKRMKSYIEVYKALKDDKFIENFDSDQIAWGFKTSNTDCAIKAYYSAKTWLGGYSKPEARDKFKELLLKYFQTGNI